MAKLKVYTVGKFKDVQVRGRTDKKPKSYCLRCLTKKGEPTDISNEPPEVKTACLKAWTDEVKEAYETHLEESAV